MPPSGKSPASARGAVSRDVWTTRKLLNWMIGHFEARQIDSPRVVAEMLLSHVLNCERMRLYMEVDRPAGDAELAQLRDLVARAAKHEPAQYLTGHAWFFSRPFEVSRATLIPRPSTETLVEHVLQWRRSAPERANLVIADIGTGTGCIAVSLAAQLKDARVIATDIVPEALELARRNAARHRVDDRIEFRLGDGTAPLAAGAVGERYDVICSNPPYVSDSEWDELEPNVKLYEPTSALRGGTDGMDVIRRLLRDAPPLLLPGGQLLIEIGHHQRDAVLAIAHGHAMLTDPVVLKDHEGFWRVLAATRLG
ncbi:MAG TPA: peptide chain release factor N(5)-glutamine methyltransferase [Phycisphaerales bacterium]|nr:peptide chain release factor N(5)-glutamine methyltransferase [Phycisphaerales bacterium]HRQ75265.1 peptide chain release factor N(5)-glutamine methyltransferase [Phycisphaerales bacterium]